MKKDLLSWLIFIALSFIWGSSYILMKIGLNKLTPFQVASIRILSAGLILLPVALKHIRSISKDKLVFIFLAGLIGNLIPAFLFCLAEQRIDTSLTGTLNSLSPIFVIITGALFFNTTTSLNKVVGIMIAFSGTLLLVTDKTHLHGMLDCASVVYVVAATVLYGFNINLVHTKLKWIGSLQIASIALFLNGILALIILIATGYFSLQLSNKDVLLSTGAATLLGTIGTAVATVIFYMLIKRAGAVFASMVTYGMPFVAIFWGLIIGENIGWKEVGCLVIILIGVYWANRNK
jgi:drug/metabolite transporter (DMT)-like permease